MATKKPVRASGTQLGSKTAALVVDPYLANLQKIDHIVILMMENRSFDHMLGYLSLTGGRKDVNGLTGKESNSYRAGGAGAPIRVPVSPATATGLGQNQDPCHAGICVDQQVASDMSGFVQNYNDSHPSDPDPGLVMRYFNATDLPVYDFFAKEFAIGDAYFSSVLGSTWPNRLYFTSGMAAGSRDNKTVPLYSNKSWVRQLDAAGVSWKGYGDGFGGHTTIKLSDSRYRSSDNYEPFAGTLTGFGFVKDCADNNLPAVSIIDPAFYKNDDHPPGDVAAGQKFVARAYNAIAKSQAWDRTLFIVVYDEHGGFYDHVQPGPAVDDAPDFRNYGVRVPVFFLGGSVPKGECFHTTWDHASIVKTILLRFCSNAGKIPNMGARVAAAAHLGEVLSGSSARAAKLMPTATVKTVVRRHTELAMAEFDTRIDMHQPTPEELGFIKACRRIAARAATAAGKTSPSRGAVLKNSPTAKPAASKKAARKG